MTLRKTSAAQRLSFSVSGISAAIQGTNLLITLSVRVDNPTDQSFYVQSLSGSLFINDQFVGEVNSYQAKTINPITVTDYPVTLFMPLDDVATGIYDLINHFSGIDLRLSGSANVDGVNVPTNIYFKVA